MKSNQKSIVIVVIVFIVLSALMLAITVGFSEKNNPEVVEEHEAVVVYSEVNFRKTPDTSDDSNIIKRLSAGDVVEVLETEGNFTKVKFDGKIGYLVNDSICQERIIFDVSDYNWGSEYSSKEEFVEFTKRAIKSCKFGGYYIQVQRTFHENHNWQVLTDTLDELKVPYGLYVYSNATTVEGAKEEYANYQEIIKGVELKYNKLPFMIDLEGRGDQSEVIRFYDSVCEDYVIYAGAYDTRDYGYYELAENNWIAHYEQIDTYLPTKTYQEYGGVEGIDHVIWQFTQEGNELLFGTDHLDVNVVSDEWYTQYVS